MIAFSDSFLKKGKLKLIFTFFQGFESYSLNFWTISLISKNSQTHTFSDPLVNDKY